MSKATSPCAGILWIGDPHAASRRPGSRTDDYVLTVLGKLREALGIAAAANLQPIITGDMFHRPRDSDPFMLGALMSLFLEQPRPPFCLVGNHDKQETTLTDDTVLAVMFIAGALRPLRDQSLEMTGGPVRVIGIAHGQSIPESVPEGAIVVTHHDFGFPDAQYPGCVPPPEIKGARYVVNGHIHKASKPVTVGATTWFNPGNITRTSRGEAENVPSVWSWQPGDVELTQHVLRHRPAAEIFEQVQVAAADEGTAVNSVFARLLAAETHLDATGSDDGAMLKTELEAVLAAAEASPTERNYLTGLFLRAVSAEDASATA